MVNVIKEELIPLFLTPEQAALFIIFQKNYETFSFIISSGVLDITQGNATLNFDKVGKLLSIERKLYTYNPKK